MNMIRLKSPQCPGTLLQHDSQPGRRGALVHENCYVDGGFGDLGDDISDDLCLHGHQWCLQRRAGSPRSGGWLRARQSDPGQKVKVTLVKNANLDSRTLNSVSK